MSNTHAFSTHNMYHMWWADKSLAATGSSPASIQRQSLDCSVTWLN